MVEEAIKKEKMKEENVNQENNEKQEKKVSRVVLWSVIAILLAILIILCFRVGKIGYNYLSIWDPSTMAPIVIKTGDLQITTNTPINVFSNKEFDGKNIIAPMSKGDFKFNIKNDTNEDVVYHVKFVDEMKNFVNMKYRLKLDNIYVRGNKDEYVKIEDLDIENVIVPKDSTSVYTLEWFWESDDEKDMYIGTQKDDQYYTLNLYIFSQPYQKGGNNN